MTTSYTATLADLLAAVAPTPEATVEVRTIATFGDTMAISVKAPMPGVLHPIVRRQLAIADEVRLQPLERLDNRPRAHFAWAIWCFDGEVSHHDHADIRGEVRQRAAAALERCAEPAFIVDTHHAVIALWRLERVLTVGELSPVLSTLARSLDAAATTPDAWLPVAGALRAALTHRPAAITVHHNPTAPAVAPTDIVRGEKHA
jgi:hypothetical protein